MELHPSAKQGSEHVGKQGILKTSLPCKLALGLFLSTWQSGWICGCLWETVKGSPEGGSGVSRRTSELANIELAGIANAREASRLFLLGDLL